MGADIHVRIAYKDPSIGKWKEVKLYIKNKNKKFEPINAFSSRDYQLFDILHGTEDPDFPNMPIVKADLPASILNEVNYAKKNIGYYGFSEANLADIKLYLKDHPLVPDYDAEWEDDKQVYIPNPVEAFVKKINYIISFAEVPYVPDSSIRIIYWFDR